VNRSTDIVSVTVLQQAALNMNIKTPRQAALLSGWLPWTRRDRPLLERLRNVRGLNVIENHLPDGVHVTIAGSLRPDGFTTVI
jgi:hypothetical protein